MASKTTKDDMQGDVDAMFGNEGPDDLLDEIEEDDSEGWNPTEKGEGICGTLIRISTTKSDFAKEGEDPNRITWTVRTVFGKRRITGFSSVLKREMEASNAEIGDTVAVKYFGSRPVKRGQFAGRPYRHFGVAVRKGGIQD